MTSDEFRNILKRAVEGDNSAFEALVGLFMPLIRRLSLVHGTLDEDLQQHLLMYLYTHISKCELLSDIYKSEKNK